MQLDVGLLVLKGCLRKVMANMENTYILVYAHNFLMFRMEFRIFFPFALCTTLAVIMERKHSEVQHSVGISYITLVQTVLCWAPAEKGVCIIKDTNCSLPATSCAIVIVISSSVATTNSSRNYFFISLFSFLHLSAL